MNQSAPHSVDQRLRTSESMTQDRRTGARVIAVPVVLSAVVALTAIIDQVGNYRLGAYTQAMYAPYGLQPQPTLLYGVVYAVAVVGTVLWLLVGRAARAQRRSAPVLAIVVTTITAGLAAILLLATEYGTAIFPPLWGILASLPPAAGVVAVVLLLRHQQGRS